MLRLDQLLALAPARRTANRDPRARLPMTTTLSSPTTPGRVENGDARRWHGRVRIIAHVTIWLTMVISAAWSIRHGWVPWWDNATIAARSRAELSLSPVLVGQFSQASHGAELIYSAGPLEYLLLALPTTVLPLVGPLLGASVVAAALGSTAIEACRRAAGSRGLVAATILVLVLLVSAPVLGSDPVWNPYFGTFAFVATIACAWALSTGAWRWGPATVITASVAMQCHSAFIVPTIACVVVGFAGGLVASRGHRARLVAWSALAGILCWLLPLVDQLAGSRNLSKLAGVNAHGHVLGVRFGLQMVARAMWGVPLFLRRYPVGAIDSRVLSDGLQAGAAMVLLLVIVGLTAVAARRGRSSQAWLGALVIAVALGLAVTFSLIPVDRSIVLRYVDILLWPFSILLWSFVIWSGLAAIVDVAPSWTRSTAAHSRRSVVEGTRVRAQMAAVAILLAGALATCWAIPGARPSMVAAHESSALAVRIERAMPRGAVNLVVIRSLGSAPGFGDELAIAYRLRVDGWSPGVDPSASEQLGPTYRWRSGARVAVLVCTPGCRRIAILVRPNAPRTPWEAAGSTP